MSGDMVVQFGNNNIGIVKSQGSLDQRAAYDQMIEQVRALRARVPAADHAALDESLDTLEEDGVLEGGRFRQALRNVLGIAAMVGPAGTSVKEAVEAFRAVAGLG
ncbi:hypothetical protein ACWC9S_08165 [Streptomyces xiamenensis]